MSQPGSGVGPAGPSFAESERFWSDVTPECDPELFGSQEFFLLFQSPDPIEPENQALMCLLAI